MTTAQDTADHLATMDDGTVLDLRRDHADAIGVVWAWTGIRDDNDQPLMRQDKATSDCTALLPLSAVYRLGPLIPLADRPAT